MHNVSPVPAGRQLNLAHPLLRGLMAWWPLTCEDPAGGDQRGVAELSPYRCRGTKQGTTMKTNSQGTYFSGSASGIIVPWKENLSDTGKEWSISCWLRLLGENAAVGNQFVYDALRSDGARSEYRLRLNRSGGPPVRFTPYLSYTDSAPDVWETVQLASPIALTEWQARGWVHIAIAMNIISDTPDGRVRMWLDGVEQQVAYTPFAWDARVCDRVEYQRGIGRGSTGGLLLNGWLRDLIIWRRELNDLEVKQIASAGGMLRKKVSHRA